MIDIVDRLSFDAARCETQFSKGVAGNIEEAAGHIKRLRAALEEIVQVGGQDLCRGIAAEALRASQSPAAGQTRKD